MKKLFFILLTLTFLFSNCKKTSTPDSTVKIGRQVWTTKNLDVATYRNGDSIPEVQDANAWDTLTTGAWCYYENNTANGTTYGKLYNWYAVNDPRGLAPNGYHIPTDAEWTKLSDYLGGYMVAGAKMKSRYGWENNGNATNSSGFTGLPGGCRTYDGVFTGLFSDGNWWSSSEYKLSGQDGALYVSLYYAYESLALGYWSDKHHGFSVRCLWD